MISVFRIEQAADQQWRSKHAGRVAVKQLFQVEQARQIGRKHHHIIRPGSAGCLDLLLHDLPNRRFIAADIIFENRAIENGCNSSQQPARCDAGPFDISLNRHKRLKKISPVKRQ